MDGPAFSLAFSPDGLDALASRRVGVSNLHLWNVSYW